MSGKQYLTMADVFCLPVDSETSEFYCSQSDPRNIDLQSDYAAHAINSHDEMVRQRDQLLASLKDLLSSKTDPGLFAGVVAADNAAKLIKSIEDSEWIGGGHSPEAGNVVAPEGWQLVPVEPTLPMLAAFVEVGGKAIRGYRAMLAAAPKLGGE